jgi:hypothetical protein
MRPITVAVGPYAAGVANGIATAQTLTQAGPFAINGSLASGGVVVLDNPRQVAITSAGNDSAIFFTVTGNDVNGNPLGETVRGANVGTVTTNNFFKRVISVTASGPTSSVTVGTISTPATSQMIRLDEWADPPLGVQVAVSGVVNYTVQHSFDEGPDSLTNPLPLNQMFWDTSLVPAGAIGGTAGLSFSIATAPLWMRILLNSGAGSVRMVVTQYNVVEA